MAGPVFAGLSQRDGGRGRIGIADREFGISETPMPANPETDWPEGTMLLAAEQDGEPRLARDPTEIASGTRTLILVPLAPMGDVHDPLAAAAERPLHITA